MDNVRIRAPGNRQDHVEGGASAGWCRRRVANVTRHDAQQYLDLAATIPVRTEVELHPLAEGNEALARLERGEIVGAAALTMTKRAEPA